MKSLAKYLPGLERMRFWMTFSENYLTHLRVIRNIGLDNIHPIDFHGQKMVPMEFLKALLPDPASLATNYSGKTVIGCIVTGVKDGKESTKFVYNVCDHAETFKEVGSQAVSYTAGVPPMVAAMLVMQGKWKGCRRVTISSNSTPSPSSTACRRMVCRSRLFTTTSRSREESAGAYLPRAVLAY